jgi:hypothetical protein
VGARDRAEGENQRHQGRARRDGVGEERNGNVPSGQALRHDPGTDHRRQKHRGSHGLGGQSANETRAIAHAENY